jgi:flagellar basal-body rod protein FlgG
MAIAALNSAATGLKALSTRIDVVSNNLANAETTAFKGSRCNFEDLMYVTLRQPGATDSTSDVSPSGIQVGLGTKISNTQVDFTEGSPEMTNRQLDVAIQGQGFFKVKVMPTVNGGEAYTRNGNFTINLNGELVVNIGDGYKVIPPITFPKNATDVTISPDGTVMYLAGTGTNAVKQKAGQLQLTNFVNPYGLQMIGGSLFVPTDSSGPPLTGNPGDNATGQILQGYLEGSNVDPVKELVTLIKTQRSFELNSQSIQTADQALQTIGNLRRG